jgi:threonine/homoserine/homoserine lactone efflux protein
MTELIFIFIGAFIVALSGALVPGPLLTVTIAESLKKGFKAGPLIIAGHALLEILLIIAILMGFKKFLTLPAVIIVIFFTGGVMLIYMGIKLLKEKNTDMQEENKTKLKKYKSNPVIKGIFVSLANPYWIIWWITIGLGYIIKALKYNYTGIAVFFGGHISADLVWYSFISFSVNRGRKKLTGLAFYQRLLAICGIFLILFGIWFIISGIAKILTV